ncbi:MAG: acyl-CoA dehydrogenase family protein [Saprospiraceae bacterium]|nr:acyl-CoA dehydrogenase family protein [Saprospiraceae bacterium]MCF8249504.1 acyl-CoA dehydrogenase family protein [Saprospiraceae bacterium]MCF8280129.1 acyl-CoA dehydrogenase family protein [Bacteroidales bacterium]MCF8310722.1 acyl-CoA dehydrogenase family protein [Saprospiraceae bacterium]MCF8439447.1 acyl-CoA dehydrogenase family protein [Saprospiraceae bacterium]
MQDTLVKSNELKGGEFIIKESAAADTFIPEDISEEQGMARQMVKDFAKDAGEKAHKLEHQVELMEKAGELGLLGCHIPEAYGGMLLDTNANTFISEELGRMGGGFATTIAAHTGIGMLPILYFGTEELKQKYLPRLVSGEWKAAYCLTEPGSGSDALAAKTRADLTPDGQHYLFNGQKMWISNAGFANMFIVFAQIDGDKFTGFVVEANTPGITLGAEEQKMGIKGSSTRQVFFENAKVPTANVLGQIGKGHLIAFNALNIGRFKLGVMCMGGAKKAIATSVQYANERKQFGQPIASFGAIKYKLAEQCIRNFALESVCYRISDLLDDKKKFLAEQGLTYADATLKAAEEYAIECAIIKVYGSEVTDYVVDEMVQIHGGLGFSEELSAARAYRDARINRIYEGTNEINRMLMVSQLLKRAMKGQVDMVGPAWEVQKELASMPSFEGVTGQYAEERKALKDFKKIVLMTAGAAVKMQMEGQLAIKDEQEIVMNIADMMIDAFVAESLLLRVERLADMSNKAHDQSVYEAMLHVYFNDATTRVAKCAGDALASFAEGDLLKTFLMGVKRFTKYAPVNVKNARRLVADTLIAANDYCY